VNLFNHLPLRIVPGKLLDEHVAVPVDDRQQVVEVVGDSAGKASNCLHFLRLPQLFLQERLGGLCLVPRRNVNAEANDVRRTVDIQAPTGEVEMASLRACTDKAAGLDIAGASRVDLLDRGGHADAVVGMNSAERLGIQDASLGHAEQDLVGLVPSDVAAVPVEYEENAWYGINDVLGECLLAAQRLFGALALGDIAHHH
jgi:hypothetical protein